MKSIAFQLLCLLATIFNMSNNNYIQTFRVDKQAVKQQYGHFLSRSSSPCTERQDVAHTVKSPQVTPTVDRSALLVKGWWLQAADKKKKTQKRNKQHDIKRHQQISGVCPRQAETIGRTKYIGIKASVWFPIGVKAGPVTQLISTVPYPSKPPL